MSLVRSNRPNWLRPVGALFVLSSILVFTQVISSVSAEIIAKQPEVDKNWIKLDSNFPSTKKDGQVQPFFFARGLFDKKMNLTQQFVDDNFVESKGITDYHVKFEIWRNKVKCNKFFSSGTELDTNPTPIEEAVWYPVGGRYSAKDFRNYAIWLAANSLCENSLVAIRDLTLTYNSYVKEGDDTPVKKIEEFKVIDKVLLEPILPDNPLVHQYYFSGCNIADACLLNITLHASQELKLTIWNSKKATLTTKNPAKTTESNNAISTPVDLKDLKDLELSFHITATDSSIVVLRIETPETKLEYTDTAKTNAFRIEDPLVSKFLTTHKDKPVHLLPHYSNNSWVYLLPKETSVTEVSNACYKFTYFVENPIHERFTISIDSHGAEFEHRYKLFDFLPIIEEDQTVEFCIADFVHDLSTVLAGNVQLVLETTGSMMNDNSLNTKMTLVFVELDPAKTKDNKDLKNVKNFITGKDTKQWNSIVPGKEADVKTPISIAANVKQAQSKQISSVWLKNDPGLNLKPVIVHLKSHKANSQTLKLEAFICDEIMECIKMTQTTNDKNQPADTVEYALEFDAHPNKKSEFLKLMLNVELPKDVGADVSLINFGNPCHEKCPGVNKICDASAENMKANDFANSCKCSPGFKGPNCDVTDFCNVAADAAKCSATDPKKCTNNADNTAFECKCDSTPSAVNLWDSTETKCVAHSTEKMKHEKNLYSWNFDLKNINPHIYDICYKFAPQLEVPKAPPVVEGKDPPASPAAQEIEGKISVVYSNTTGNNKREITLVDAQPFHLMEGAAAESVIVDLCLSKLLDKYVTRDAKLTITVDVNHETSFLDAHSHLYARFIEDQTKSIETKSLAFKEVIAIPNKLINIGEVNKDTKKQLIEFAEPHTDLKPNSKIILISEWIVNHPKLAVEKIANNMLELGLDATSEGYLEHQIEICRPLTGNSDDCVEYKNDLQRILPGLNSDKFHIKIIIKLKQEAKAPVLKNLKLNFQVSLWDACQIEKVTCQNKAECKSGTDISAFTCHEIGQDKCPAGFSGVFCEITNSASCTPGNEAECKRHNTACIPLADNKFSCDCPSGYQYDSVGKKCDRMKVKPITQKCDSKSCFIDGILSSSFTYLPAHFPQYDSSDSRELYYTVQSDSKITISVEDLTKKLSERNGYLENDVCVKFSYFVAPEAKLSLRYEDQIQLQVIDGVSLIEKTTLKEGVQIPLSLGMSTPTEVCLKALLALNKLHTVDKFKLVFVSQTSSPDHAIAIELLHSNGANWVETPANVLIPSTGLRYLSKDAKGLNVSVIEKFSYLWPVRFPSPSRWSHPPTDDTSLQLQRQHSNTIETAYLESSWIERSLRSNQPVVYLAFKMEIDFAKEEDLKVDIYLIDSDRHILGQVTSVNPSHAGFDEGKQHKTGQFVFPLNRFEIEQTKSYKVQFVIRYHDKQIKLPEDLPYLLKISDISFGDPCMHVDQNLKVEPQVCYSVDKEGNPRTPDPSTECERIPLAGTLMDFKCHCNHASLFGKNCYNVDSCKFDHPIIVKYGDEPIQTPKRFTMNGDLFCRDANNEKKNIATCKPGRFQSTAGDFDFLCECNDKKTPHRFDIGTQQCVPIGQCILNPCDLETELCKEETVGSNVVKHCTCKSGYSKATANATCTPTYLHEQNECNVETECNSKDKNMKCLAGNGISVCKCPKGFKYAIDAKTNEPKCESNYCEYPGLNKCQQSCESINTEPFYKCSCHAEYDLVPSADAAIPAHACKPKSTSQCQNCNGKYRVCKSGVCGCEDKFVLDTKGENCVPLVSHKIPSCPNGRFKIDSLNEVVCDCAYPAGNTTKGYFVDEQLKGSCKLEKTICDVGEVGRSFCSKREAGCVMDPLKYDDYSCQCKLGKLFSDGRRVKKHSDIRDKMICLDICDLPYKKSQCAGIGARCNPWKLWSQVDGQKISSVEGVATEKYCDCIPGTFYDEKTKSCLQEPQALLLNISMRWTHELQKQFDKLSELLRNQNAVIFDELPVNEYSMEYIDSIGYGRAWIRANQLNREAEKDIETEWSSLVRKSSLFAEAENMLYNLKLIDHHSAGGLALVRHDVKVVSNPELVNGHYVLSIAVKISSDFRLSTDAMYAESDEEEMPAGQDTATATSAPTTVPTTTPDPNNPLAGFNLAAFKDITSNCQKLAGTDNCIIPYMSLVLASDTNPTPILHKPCLQAETCEGLSDCIPQSGSQFECACNENYFDVESRYTFKAHDSIVFKNDRCKSRVLCSEKCPTTQTNRECIEKDPVRSHENDTFIWKKDVHCGCAAHFGEATPATAGQLPQCTAVCSIAACTSNGKCKGEAHSASCECEEGYYGLRCEHAPASVTGWIVAVALLAVLTLVGVGAAIFFWRSSSESTTTSHSSSSSTLTRTTSNRANQPIRRNSHKTFANLQDMPNSQPKSTSNINLSHNLDSSNQQFSNVSLAPQTSSEITTHSTTIVTSANNKSYEVRQVEASNQQSSSSSAAAATVVATASSVSSFAKPKDHRLEQIYAEEKLSQKSFSQNSQNDDASSVYSGLKFTAARGSFISADMNSLDFSRQESEDSLTVNEPFTPSPTSPLSQLTNQQSPQHHATHPHLYQRRSISVRRPSSPHPIAIAEKNELLYSQIKDELRVNQKTNDNQQNNKSFSHSTSSSSSNSLSSDSLSQSNGQPPTIDPPPPPPPAPSPSEDSKFTTMNDEPPEPENPKPEISSSSSTSTSSASSHRPSTSDSNNKNLFSDSQEMNQDKFKHVRNKIAAVLRINSFKSYELTKNDDKPLGPR